MPILKRETSLYPANLLDEFEQQSDESTERRWWAVYTRSRQEKSLARQLLAYEIPFYLPLIPKDQLIRGRKTRSHIPLFSNYLFMYGDDEERVKTLTTNRISRILEIKDQGQVVGDLRNVEGLINAGSPLTVESRLTPGDKVRIMKGSLAGLEGQIIRRSNTTRLLVAVTYLQQGVSVEIDDFVVEPI